MLVIKKGVLLPKEDSLEKLETYAKRHRTKVVSALLYKFDGSPVGKLAMSWADGTVALYFSPSFRRLSVRLREHGLVTATYGGVLPQVGIPSSIAEEDSDEPSGRPDRQDANGPAPVKHIRRSKVQVRQSM